jgi:hypothetical protein
MSGDLIGEELSRLDPDDTYAEALAHVQVPNARRTTGKRTATAKRTAPAKKPAETAPAKKRPAKKRPAKGANAQ